MKTVPLRQSGFTVVELLTAVFITMIMMLMIARIFSDTTAAVADGIGLSELMAKGRSISDQLQRDLKRGTLIGPDDDADELRAFMVIVNHAIGDDASEAKPRYFLPGGGEGTRVVRADQLFFFIRSTSGSPLRAATPGYSDSYYNPVSAGTARVWYGPVTPIRTSFSSSFTQHAAKLGLAGSLNQFCTNWALGRHALLLADPQEVQESGIGTAASDAYGTSLANGVTDVASVRLQTIIDTNLSGGAAPMPASSYRDEALRYGFVTSPRLAGRVNMGLDGQSQLQFTPTEVAQLQHVLATNCSDFIVEFAGNYDGAPGRDLTGADTDPNRRIRWYAGQGYADDRGVADAATGTFTPNFVFTNPTSPDTLPITGSVPISEDGGNAVFFVFRHDEAPDTNNWPELLRVRYRLHDERGRLQGRRRTNTSGVEVGDGVDNDGDGLQDEQSEDNSGKWFEVIVRLKSVEQD